MRVCDRHPRTKATNHIHFASTDSKYDLCDECSALIMEFIGEIKKKEVEDKPKRKKIFGV